MVNTATKGTRITKTYTNAKVISVTVQGGGTGFSRIFRIDKFPDIDLFVGPPVGMASDLLNILCLGTPVDITIRTISDNSETPKIIGAVAILNT